MIQPKLTIELELGDRKPIALCKPLSDEMAIREMYQPIKTSNSGMQFLDTDLKIARKIKMDRQEFAKNVAQELTDAIIELLSERDLFNGYSNND